MVGPELLSLDARRLDDRPPFFDLGLLQRGESVRRLLMRGKISSPRLINRSRTVESAKASTIAASSLSITFFGVPFGAHTPPRPSCRTQAILPHPPSEYRVLRPCGSWR